MKLDRTALLDLLPALYRFRDADQGGALATLVDILAEQVQVLQEDLAQLYDDQFIETCADWVVPYIGALIGYRPFNGATASVSSPRAEVADTIRLRRGKGTVGVLEDLAHDVTGWDAHVVEAFQRIAATQYVKHVRAGRGGSVDVRDPLALERIGTAFDDAAHGIDVRAAARGGRWNLPNVMIHLWSLAPAELSFATASGVEQRFFFNPLGIDTPLYRRSVPKDADAVLSSEANVAMPITRRALDADPDAFYGVGLSIFIDGLPAQWAVRGADLSDADETGTRWAHEAPAETLLIDPVLGRFAVPVPMIVPPAVWFVHGSPGNLGGGEYERASTFDDSLSRVVEVILRAPGGVQDGVQLALSEITMGGAAEFGGSYTWSETPTVALDADIVVELRAVDQARPTLKMDGTFEISGGSGAELTLNGLVITGGALHVAADGNGESLRLIRLVHCTLVPGITLASDGRAQQPGVASLVVDTVGTRVELDHCIVGALRVAPTCSVQLDACIVDAGDASAVAFAGIDGNGPGASLQASETTVIGRIHSAAITSASNCILHAAMSSDAAAVPWPAPVWSERRQEGCIRFSYLPLASMVPRRYRCQPAVATDATRVVPMFDSLRYGDANYGRVNRRTAAEVLGGADDAGEMGVFHEQLAQQREANLRIRLTEFLRIGLDAGLVFAD